MQKDQNSITKTIINPTNMVNQRAILSFYSFISHFLCPFIRNSLHGHPGDF